jgi:hypothetical protein
MKSRRRRKAKMRRELARRLAARQETYRLGLPVYSARILQLFDQLLTPLAWRTRRHATR